MRRAEDDALRRDMEMGGEVPLTPMQSDTVGTRHTVVLGPPEQGRRKRVRYATSLEHVRMGAPGGQEFEIQAIIGRKRVNPVGRGDYTKRRRGASQGGSQTQYLVVFEGTGDMEGPYPPEWVSGEALAHGDPEADLRDFLDSGGDRVGTLDSTLPDVGRYV